MPLSSEPEVRYASVINTGNVTDDYFSSLSSRCGLTVLQLYIHLHENSGVRNDSDSPPYKSEMLAKSCTSVATSAKQAELFRVVREGHPIPESTCWTSPIVMQPVQKRPSWSNGKSMCFYGNSHPHSKKTEQRIPETLSDFALLVARVTPSLAACTSSIRRRVSGTE